MRQPSVTLAFTLLELLVSMSLLVVLLLILLSMVDGSTKLWRVSENRVDSYREARAAINTIAADLGTIVPSKNPKFFALDTTGGLPESVQQPPDADTLFFLSAQTADSQENDSANGNGNRSDLCVVGYFLAYAKVSPNSAMSSMNLYRYFRSSDKTFKDSLQAGDLVPTPPSADPTTGEELLARNVTAFHVAAYTALPSGKLTKFVKSSQTVDSPMPNVVEIEISVINNESAQRLQTLDAWKNKDTVDRKQNLRTFRTRVRLSTDSVIVALFPTPTPAPSPAPGS